MTDKLAKYGSYELEAVDQEADQLNSGGRFLKLDVGRNVVRFLPPPVGARSPWVIAYSHTIDVPGTTERINFNCPRIMAKKPCPACQKGERLRTTGNPADKQFADQLNPRARCYANVISRKSPDSGPMILGCGKTVKAQLDDIRKDTREGGDFTNPEEDGFDIIIDRDGTGQFDTKYKVRPARSATELGNMDWIEQQTDLSAFMKVPTIEEIKQMLGAAGSADESTRQRNAATRETRTAAPAMRRGATVEDGINDVEE